MRSDLSAFLCFFVLINWGFSQVEKQPDITIPKIIYSPNESYVELYNKAWELALDHIKYEEGMPQSPYIDEAFWDHTIWIWDTEFMMLFYKHAQTPFSSIKSLNNFYHPIHKGVEMPLRIEILDNPPFFAWIEYEYFKFSNDQKHLNQLLNTDQYLQKHFHWFDTVSKGTVMVNSVPTCIEKENNGYTWEGGRSGMDNTPRGRRGKNAVGHRPNHPDMLWIDAIAQQGLAALYTAKLLSNGI